jgi:hypothetical protein
MQRIDMRRSVPLALIAIATSAAGAGCGSSAGKPAAQDTQAAPTQPTATKAVTTTRPAAAAAPRKFTSHRYGFRVTLTPRWSEKDAHVAWDGTKLQGLDSDQFANFNDPRTGRALVVAAAPVPKRMRLPEWRAAMVRAAPSVCSQSSSASQKTLGGEPALAWTGKCSDGFDVRKLAALHGTRGYMLFLASPTARNDADDRRIFDSIRRSFRFMH